ncbi:MAG: hypothetical protein AB7O97_19690 [Planctomycetota bacterium]
MTRTSRCAFAIPWVRLCLLAAPAALAGCASSSARDLAANDLIYRDVDYRCKVPGDRSVFVAPVADGRTPLADAVAIEGGYPILYDADGRWDRPVVEMVDEVLRREVADSTVFARVAARPADADVVLMPTLVSFSTAAMECEAGGRSLADVALRVQAYGPIGADGQRPLLVDRVFGERKLSDVAFRTTSRHVLAGAAAMATMQQLLQGLDAKNVGRDGMPVATDPSIDAGLGLPPAAPPPTGGR